MTDQKDSIKTLSNDELNLLLMCVKERIAYLRVALHDVEIISKKLSQEVNNGN